MQAAKRNAARDSATVLQEKESNLAPEPMRLMERSVFSDRMVFVKAVHEARWMNDMELSVYDAW